MAIHRKTGYHVDLDHSSRRIDRAYPAAAPRGRFSAHRSDVRDGAVCIVDFSCS